MISASMKNTKNNEDGFAALIVGMILVLVLALITVGFAQMTRKEEQSALSKQLGAQAYYAAESGVNDAYKDIKLLGNAPSPITNCANDHANSDYPDLDGATSGHNLNAADEVGYTCVLVSPITGDVDYSDIGNNGIKSAIITTASAADTLTISWKVDPAHGGSCFQQSMSATKPFPISSVWKTPPSCAAVSPLPTDAMEVSLTPLNGAGGFDRDSLVNNSAHAVLYPVAAGKAYPGAPTSTAFDANSLNGPQILSGSCATHPGNDFKDGSAYCTAAITGLKAGTTSATRFLITMKGVYSSNTANSNVVLKASDGGGSIDFVGTQAVIDSTGKAQDQLKRIQVRVDLSGGTRIDSAPGALVGTGGVCKRMLSQPSGTGTTFYGLNGGQAPGVPAAAGSACDGTTN